MVGVWQVADLAQVVTTSYARSNTPLQVDSVEGQTLYQFDSAGGMLITFQSLTANLSGAVEGQALTARSEMTGTATASYQVDEAHQQIVLSSFGGDGIQFSLDINGQRLAEGDLPAWRAFSASLASQDQPPAEGGISTTEAERARASVSCRADRLTIQALDPQPGPEMILNRVQ